MWSSLAVPSKFKHVHTCDVELLKTFPRETLVYELETCIRLFLAAAYFLVTKLETQMFISRLVRLIVAYPFSRLLQSREN